MGRHVFILISVFFVIIIPTRLSGQSKGSIEDYIQLNPTPPGEKVFLHIDRPNFTQGDTIWFKAYLWYGYDQVPDTISGVLYVDLINPEGKVELKKKLLIKNGTSHGDFSLANDIKPGRYTLRAYTRWMRNPDTGEPYYQPVIINPANQNFEVECVPVILKRTGNDSLEVSFRFFEMNPSGDFSNSYNHNVNYSIKVGENVIQTGNAKVANTKEQVFRCSLAGINENDSVAVFGISIQDDRLSFEKQFQIPVKESIDLQFFPEGGRMITGLKGRIAFKAIGTDGLSREVKGDIEDGDEKVITSFESSYKGMGTFLLKPEAKKEYFAHLWYDNRKYIIPLPPAADEGCYMSVISNGNGNDPSLMIKQSPSEINNQKYVVGSSYGKIRFAAKIKSPKDSLRVRIPLGEFPEGISRLTVLDANFEPECERLIYVDKGQRFNIEIKPDSTSWEKRSKVTLYIKTTGPGGTPVQTDLSLAVVDKEQLTREEMIKGISSYKLLESELKGYIEDVDSYFKNDSIANYDALDLLLLTQGYRKFVPGNTNPDEQKFQPEKSFDISGKVKFGGSKAREAKYNYQDVGLTLVCAPLNQYILLSNPDSLGQFAFHIPLHEGRSISLLQASTPKRRHFRGSIFIDQVDTIPQFNTPQLSDINISSPAIESIRQLQAVRKTEITKDPSHGAMTLNLPEVTVTSRAKNWYIDFDRNAKKVADMDSLDPEGKKYETLFDLLVKEFGARDRIIYPGGHKIVLLPCIGFGLDYWFPIFVVDGNTYFNGGEKGEMFFAFMNLMASFPVNEIKKIMVIPPGIIADFYADIMVKMDISQSLVVIETYSNNTYRGDPQGIKTFILDGLDAPRQFYSPRYDGASKNSQVFDGRATLLWEPSVRTDANGQAKIDFFTSDRQSSLEVFVNGIEVGSGNPGQTHKQINQ